MTLTRNPLSAACADTVARPRTKSKARVPKLRLHPAHPRLVRLAAAALCWSASGSFAPAKTLGVADPHALDPFEVRSIEVAGCAPTYGEGDVRQMRVGEVYRSLVTSGARMVKLPSRLSPGGPLEAEDYGFDLWSAVEKYRLPADSSVMVTVPVESDRDVKAVLGIGCSDEFYLLDGNKVVLASEGSRGYVRCQNLVRMPLHKGHNIVRLICHRAREWDEPPTNHYAPEWILGLDLFATDGEALRKHDSRDLHVLATPVVPSFADLRLVTALSRHNRVALYGRSYRELANGVADRFGRITWSQPLPAGRPFFGAIEQERRSEPVLVCDAGQGAGFVTESFRSARAADDANPWWVRAEILAHAKDHDQYWRYRQLLQTLAGGVVHPAGSDSPGLLADYPLRDLRYYTYRSHIDGTNQHFRMWEPEGAKNVPIVVVLPPVNDPVRPFLRSATVANVAGNEDLVALASARGCAVVWPGYIESDFGGQLSEAELAESLSAVRRTLPPGAHKLFLVGVCSSGIAALRYAERHHVDGLALISPLIERDERRYLPGIGLDDLFLPRDLEIEGGGRPKTASFVHIPVYIDYSTVMPGHGDPKAARAFANAVRNAGGEVSEDFPHPATWYTWGERDRVFMRSAFAWIAKQLPLAAPPQFRRNPAVAPPRTIKDALLCGFVVERSQDGPLAAWLEGWRRRWRSFRGAPWSYAGSAASALTIAPRVIGSSDLEAIASGAFFKGRAHGLNRDLMAQLPQIPLFGMRLVGSGSGRSVELFRTPDATRNFPRFDPVVDGEFSGILWGQVSGEWLLIGAWQ